MLENINLNGAQVSAELHGFMYQGVYGYSGIYNFDNKCEAVIQSNNEIKIRSGLLVNKGRFLRIKGTESVMIQNNSSGVNRTDLIVARFTTDGINEKHVLAVIKGTSESVPSYTSGDIYNGATTCELPLYAVHLTGTRVDAVTQVCDTIYSDYQNITNNLSNENQVINGNFAINQRGHTTYTNDALTNVYTVDRWMCIKSKVEVVSGGVKVTSLSTNGSSVWFKQLFENTIEGACTLSCYVTSVTGNVYLFSQAKGIKIKQGFNKVTLSDLKQVSFELKQGASITLKWVKLEKGSVATPFVAPNTNEELQKCKMYYNKLNTSLNGYYTTQTYVSCELLTQMRTTPTISCVGSFWLYYWGSYTKYNFSSVGTISLTTYNEITILIAPNSTSQVCTLVFELNSYIALDAEIYA